MVFSRPWKRKKLDIYSPILPNYTLSHFLFFSLQLESHSLCLSYFSYLISLLLYSFIFISFYFTSSFIIHSFFLILRILQRWWAFKPRPACLGLVLYIYIYIEGVDGKIYKQCGKWCVVCKTRSFQPPHGGQKIRAVPLLFKNKT